MTHSPTTSICPSRRGRPPLLPTLFDRLQDDNPSQSSEPPSAYAHSPETLRRSIRRDLAFLLNTLNASDLIDATTHPHAVTSCLNFGIPPLAGRPVDAAGWADIENLIRNAIGQFEPRFDPASLQVKPLPRRPPSAGRGDGHLLHFEIRVDIRARPYPLEFLVQSAIDLETSRLGDFT